MTFGAVAPPVLYRVTNEVSKVARRKWIYHFKFAYFQKVKLFKLYGKKNEKKSWKKMQVPPRFELGSLDSKSRVLTITPWDLTYEKDLKLLMCFLPISFTGFFLSVLFFQSHPLHFIHCIVLTLFVKKGCLLWKDLPIEYAHE